MNPLLLKSKDFTERQKVIDLPFANSLSPLKNVHTDWDKINITDGTNDYILGPKVAYNPENLSCFVWTRGTYPRSNDYIFNQYDYGANKRVWAIITVNSDRLRVALSSNGLFNPTVSVKRYNTNYAVFDGELHLVGFTWNAGVLKLWVDGEEALNVHKEYDAAFTSLYVSDVDLYLCSVTDGALPFSSNTPRAFMFNSTLTEEQNLELFQTNKVVGANNILNWDLKSAAQYGLDGVIDLSGNGNHGTHYGQCSFTRSTSNWIVDADKRIREIPANVPRFEDAIIYKNNILWPNNFIEWDSGSDVVLTPFYATTQDGDPTTLYNLTGTTNKKVEQDFDFIEGNTPISSGSIFMISRWDMTVWGFIQYPDFIRAGSGFPVWNGRY